MGSHSEHGRYVEGYADRVLVAQGPVDAGAVRDGVVNNINHLIDGAPQPIANLVQLQGGYWRVAAPSLVLKTFNELPHIVFPLMIRPDGRSANVQIWMRALMSAAGTGTFVVTLGLAHDLAALPSPGTASTMSKLLTTSSTTGDDLDFDALLLTADMLGTLAGPRSAFTGRTPALPFMTRLPNGSRIARARIVVRASSTTSAEPRIRGLHVRQYIGS